MYRTPLVIYKFPNEEHCIATAVRTVGGLVDLTLLSEQSRKITLPDTFWKGCVGKMHTGSSDGLLINRIVSFRWITQGTQTLLTMNDGGKLTEMVLPFEVWRMFIRTFEEK